MAASMLYRRTADLCGMLKGISSLNSVLSATISSRILLQAASYNPKRLKLSLKDPYIPDKNSEKTPDWQKTEKYDRKLFGRYGSASGIDPASLWPSHEQLDKIIAEEKEWHPSLEVMLQNIEVREAEVTKKRLAREKLIAENMAKMPKMVADWCREKSEKKKKLKEEKDRRSKLLTQVRERFGSSLDPRSKQFKELVAEMEKEEKKQRKLLKQKMRLEQEVARTIRPAGPL
ncbi:large ribosomal subunit protein mL64 [Antennarius striatus]|uniref:large ribosomal subunit protein mL64 n=1 Tax=Antennarius striatus TaxID=241820 RepID=UPI0035B3E5AB